MTERHAAFEPAFNMEDDVSEVFDLALILHNHLSRPNTLDGDTLGALARLAGDLFEASRRLRGHHMALCRAVGLGAPDERAGRAA